MAKSIINAQTRDGLGSNKSNYLRKTGFIPGILYGSHMAPQPVKLDTTEFEKFAASNYVGSKVFVNIDGKEIMALLKEVQKDVFGNKILHVDLQALTKGDKVKLHVRLNYFGKDKLPQELISQELISELEIETLPENMIDSISVDISEMKFGDVMKVSDLPIVNDPNIRVISDLSLPLLNLIYRSNVKDEVEPEAVPE